MKRRTERGAALVEFALIVPLMLLIVLITADLARALYRYNGVVKSVRNATRFLTTEAPDDPAAADMARNLVVYGKVSAGGDPIDPELTADKIDIPPTSFTGSAPDPVIRTVTVTVSGYTLTPMLTSFFGTSFSIMQFSDISATMRHPL